MTCPWTASTRSIRSSASPSRLPDASVSAVVISACVTASNVVFVDSLT
jgi:hypothetical protein